MTHRLHVLISGQVQGVGFRFSTHRQANAQGLNGWVRNLPDGTVEAEFEGERAALESMLDWCRQGPSGAAVDDVEAAWDEGEPRYHQFSVRS